MPRLHTRSPAERIDPFESLGPGERETVLASASRLHAPARTRLFDAGAPSDRVYFVERGRVRTFAITATGDELTTGLWSTGYVLGLIGATADGAMVLSAETIDDASLLVLPVTQLRQLATRMPQFGWNLTRTLAWMASTGISRALRLSTASVDERLLDALVMLADMPDARCGDGSAIAGISQETIAGMVGATRPWVVQALGRLARDGLIEIGRMRIVVPDLARLRAAAKLG